MVTIHISLSLILSLSLSLSLSLFLSLSQISLNKDYMNWLLVWYENTGNFSQIFFTEDEASSLLLLITYQATRPD